MKDDNRKHLGLYDVLNDLKYLQDLLSNSWSKYFGHYFSKLVGSDTIPFYFITKQSKPFIVVNPKTHTPTSYFRIEAIDKSQVTVTLLRAFDLNDNDTNIMTDVMRLEKTEAQLTIQLHSMLAIQLLEPALLGGKFYIESKW